jgi:hypothetical protein
MSFKKTHKAADANEVSLAHQNPRSGGFLNHSRFSRSNLLLLITVFAAIGTYYLLHSLAAPSLLSQGKLVTASSTDASASAPSSVVDGDSSTRWSSSFSDPQWLQTDLGGIVSVSEVKLNWEAAYGKAYRIQVSNDAVNWTDIYSTTTADGGIDDITGLSAVGRYVRMYGTARGTQWGYSLWEMQVYGSVSDSGATSFTPIADSYVANLTPTTADPASQTLWVDGGNITPGDDVKYSYLKFDLSALAGKTVTSAKLRMFVTNPTTQAKSILSIGDTSWPEAITWNTRPAFGSNIGSTPAANQAGVWDESDITSYVASKSAQLLSLGFDSGSGIDGYGIDSREGNNKPQLVISYATPDTTPPTISLTSPANGATLSGTVNVNANATDNVGVTRVDFLRNGTVVNSDTTAPYGYAWDTTAVANANYTLQAKAYDAAGNSASSSTVTVTVSNTGPSSRPTITGTTYYVDCNGNNNNDGKATNRAWKDASRANQASLTAGDGILFKRGCVWNYSSLSFSGVINIKWNGVIVSSYGSGALPQFNTTSHSGVIVHFGGSSNTVMDLSIDGPDGSGSNYVVYGFEFANGAKNNVLRDSYASGMHAGVFLRSGSSYNKIGPNNQFIANKMINDRGGSNDDSGAFGVLLHGNNNEIFANIFRDNNAFSKDYGRDGSSIELYTSCNASPASNNKIYNNRSYNDDAFTETGRDGGSSCTTIPENNVFAYNVFTGDGNHIFINTRGGLSGGFGGVRYTKAYNNVSYITNSSKNPVICSGSCDSSSFIYKNNISVASKGLSVQGSLVSNNITSILSGSTPSPNPRFVNGPAGDFRLQTDSPAINAGSMESISAGFKLDFLNHAVPFGSSPDVGAYEYGY